MFVEDYLECDVHCIGQDVSGIDIGLTASCVVFHIGIKVQNLKYHKMIVDVFVCAFGEARDGRVRIMCHGPVGDFRTDLIDDRCGLGVGFHHFTFQYTSKVYKIQCVQLFFCQHQMIFLHFIIIILA